MKGLAVAVCLCGILLACSEAAPSITKASLSLVYYEEEDKVRERYTLFVLPQDDDGFQDLGYLYLIHDFESLQWKLTSDDWVREDIKGQTWIGSRAITMGDGSGSETLPRGSFRVVLEDKGGSRGERAVAFDGPEQPEKTFPVFSVSAGTYSASSTYPANYLLCFNRGGEYLNPVPLPALGGRIAELRLGNEVEQVCLWAEDPERSVSCLTKRVPLR
jgi:hypothetical protein